MTTVGASDAKTHLNELLRRVANGEVIHITRRGVPVAKLVPADDDERQDVKKTIREIREIRKGTKLRGLNIKELINEGRRY